MSSSRDKFSPKSDAGGNLTTDQMWQGYGARLTHVRGDVSQAQFATKVGTHKNTLGNYERGEREVSAAVLRALVNLGWNANWLLTGEGPERLDAYAPASSKPMRLQDGPETRATPASERSVPLDMDALFFAISGVLAEEAKAGAPLPLATYIAEVAHAYRAHAYSTAFHESLHAAFRYADAAAEADKTANTFYAAFSAPKPPPGD